MPKKLFFLLLMLFTLLVIQEVKAVQQAPAASITDSSRILSDSASVNRLNSQVSEQPSSHTEGEAPLPSPYMVIPFILLLLMIATGPIFYSHFWESHYPKVAIFLGLFVAAYYYFFLKDSSRLMHTVTEYLSFIALLGSLFVASGGILIRVDRKATPLFNVLFLLFGAVISNVIGTTGASMLLIRPFIKMNGETVKPYHILFFIFIVSNVGGMLTPIGDPPLFLGFLSGVPFFWVIGEVWMIWIPALLAILTVFYFIDSRHYNKVMAESTTAPATYSGKIEFRGLKNLVYLLIIIISVFIDPKVIHGIPSLYPLPIGLREIIMFGVMFFAFKTADKEALAGNEFDFGPIKEVAYLFIGIFLTMIPALQTIAEVAKQNSGSLNEGLFYWATGALSSFLDNAPTYLNFLSAAMGKFGLNITSVQDVRTFMGVGEHYLVAISVGAVFFGSMTYIGNGPNFMVKSISERAGIKMPSFLAYMVKFSIPVLLPIFFLIWFIFFRS